MSLAQESIRRLYIGRETTEGTLASQLFLIPFNDFKHTPKDTRFVPQEYQGQRVRDRKAVRVKKYSELSFKCFAYYDLAGWLFLSAFNAPTTARKGSPAGVNNVQTITFGGSWLTADTFTLTVMGYTTANITYSSVAGTLQTNITNALAALPSIAAAGNVTVSSSATVPTVTFQGNLASTNVPLMSGAVVSSAAGTISVANTTPGVGQYDSTFIGGGGSLPTLSIVYYDGSSYRQYLGASIDSLDIQYTVDKAIEFDVKALSRFEVTATPTNLPILSVAAYSEPIDPTQLAVSISGSNYQDLISAKIQIKQNRQPFHSINAATGTGMSRATEGFVQVTFDITADYNYASNETASLYYKWINNTALPTSLAITATDAATTMGGGSNNPVFALTLPNPILVEGSIDSMKPSDVMSLKGIGGYDTTTAGAVKAVLTNETPRYSSMS